MIICVKIFFIFFVFYIVFQIIDGGIIPQQNEKIQEDFGDEYGESRVGLYGSIDYIGRIIGAIVMSILINKLDRRIFYSFSCFFKAINCFIPLITTNYYANIFARLLSGIPQTYLTSYGTIWNDQFSKRKNRSMNLQIF